VNTQYPMPLAHAVSYAPQDFIQNDALSALLQQLAGWQAWQDAAWLLVGAQGSGKTHLLHTLAATTNLHWITRSTLGDIPSENLLKPGALNVIEDIDTATDDAALAQAINVARAGGRALLLTSNLPVASMQGRLPDVVSRLKSLPTVSLPAPDEALLMAVMHKRLSDLQWRVAPEVVQYVVTRLPREFVALQHFIEASNHEGLALGRALTLPLARSVLSLCFGKDSDV